MRELSIFGQVRLLKSVILPVCLGVVIYFTIRLIVDPIAGLRAWERPWVTTVSELLGTVAIIWVCDLLLKWRLNKLKEKEVIKPSIRQLLREFVGSYVYCFVTINALGIPLTHFTDNGMQLHDLIVMNIIPMFFIMVYFAISRSNHYLKAYVESRLALQKLSNSHLESELKFLKAQLHPHFLFNALNTVYFQMDESVEVAKVSLEKLSKLLRYQLYDESKGLIPVRKELEYLKNYISLQQVRKSEKVQLKLSIDESLQQQLIHPYLLMPYVENAFKYVGSEGWINISLKKVSDRIQFDVENSFNGYNSSDLSGGGVGLGNLRRRLDLLYADRAEMKIENEKGAFRAQLNIPWDEN